MLYVTGESGQAGQTHLYLVRQTEEDTRNASLPLAGHERKICWDCFPTILQARDKAECQLRGLHTPPTRQNASFQHYCAACEVVLHLGLLL